MDNPKIESRGWGCIGCAGCLTCGACGVTPALTAAVGFASGSSLFYD